MKKKLQHLVSAAALALFVFIAFGSMDDDGDSSSSSSSGTVSADNTATAKQIGETLSTKYFDVTVNEVSRKYRKSICRFEKRSRQSVFNSKYNL